LRPLLARLPRENFPYGKGGEPGDVPGGSMSDPFARLRRLRASEAMRTLVRETTLDAADLVYPIFVTEGQGIRREVPSMPGVFQLTLDRLPYEAEELLELGIRAVILFGVLPPERKDERGSGAYDPEGIVQRALRELKRTHPELVLIADTCLCEYTSHGHCGLVEDGKVLNDASLPLHAAAALSQAQSGADVVAPSSMMDGVVAAIRSTLNEHGFTDVPILAYSVKYASAFYGPFRDAAQSAPAFGDRRTYQMDPANAREALREAEADVAQGADLLMVKPALAYLDVIRLLRERFSHPLVAYNVSGEYSMVKAAARLGWLDERRTVREILLGIRRAGADLIITYHAKDVARWLKDGSFWEG